MSKEQGGFISNIFLVPKDEERWRLILNLKSLNEFVAYEHFKMEDIRCVKDLLSRGDHMQAGSKRCIPLNSDPQVMQEVSQVQMARDTV